MIPFSLKKDSDMATIEQITADPRFAKATPEQKQRLIARAENAPQSFKDKVFPVAREAMREAIMRPGTMMRDLATDPVTQAKAVPYLAGAAGSALGKAGGATVGLTGGRQLSNAALISYGRPEEMPSATEQVLEGALSFAGDLAPIPAINRKIFGKAVGAAERSAGVPEFVPSMKRPTGPDSTARFIDWAREIRGNPPKETLKQIKDQIDFIYKNRKNVPLSDLDEGKLKFLNQWIQSSLNKAAPGRKAAADALKESQLIPRTIKNTYKSIPSNIRGGMETYGIPGAAIAALVKALGIGGGNHDR